MVGIIGYDWYYRKNMKRGENKEEEEYEYDDDDDEEDDNE